MRIRRTCEHFPCVSLTANTYCQRRSWWGGTADLIYADPQVLCFRNNAKEWDSFTDVFDPAITTGELPASLMAAGYIRHTREVNTAILATEAYGESVVINLAMKAVTRRECPSDVPPGETSQDTFFNGSNLEID